MKNPSSLLLIAILATGIAHTGAQPAQAGMPREQALTKAQAPAPEETATIQQEPRDACSCNNSGVAKQLTGDLQGAIADFDMAIALDPNFAAAWNNRGNARLAMHDFPAAIADYSRAIELDPRSATAYFNRGKAREVSGDSPGALADYHRAAELDQTLTPPAAV